MDEASQCVEPEALVPLKLGMYLNSLRDFWSKNIETKNFHENLYSKKRSLVAY